MKKFLFLGALAAMLLGTASCSNDMEPVMSSDGTVQFKVELPGNIDSRSISDGTTATKLEVACYNANGEILADLQPTVKTDFVNREATVTYKLVKGQTYNFAFFAHADGAPYTFTPGTNMTECKFDVNYTGACNDESRDAFYAVLKDYAVTTAETTVTLYRPFAQLNFGADDLDAAEDAGIIPSQSMVTVKKAATSFGLFTEEATGEADVTYTLANLPNDPAKLTVEGTNYDWMEMCYFLVPANEANVDVEMTVKTNISDVKVPVANVPVKKNHRTNIVGSLFTQDANFRIIIDQDFDDYDYDIVNGQLMLKAGMTTDEINSLIAKGFGSFALAENLDITEPIVVPAGITATLNLNGHNITNTTDIWAGANWSLISVHGGNLTINGNGDVIAKADDCYAIDVRDGGKITINGGNYSGNITAVYAYEGHATINGGSFNIQQLSSQGDYRFLLNLYDANGKNGTASIEVTGGKFYNFDPSNNLAENPQVNFVALGYESTQDGDWYNVAPITPLSDPAEIAAAAAVPGKTVVVAPGTNLYLDLSTIAEGVTLYGKGAILKFTKADSKDADHKINKENITIANFIIDNTDNYTGLEVNVKNFTLKNCTWANGNYSQDAIRIQGGDANGVILIDGCEFEPEVGTIFKAIHVFGKSTVKIVDSTIDAIYPFNCNGSNNNMIIENSTLKGWTSWNNDYNGNGTGHTVTFTNCTFTKCKSGYAIVRPYTTTYFNNCTFSADMGFYPTNACTCVFTGCTFNDRDYFLVGCGPDDGTNCIITIDGVTYKDTTGTGNWVEQ